VLDVTCAQKYTLRRIKPLGNGETSILNVGLFIAIAFIAIAFLWLTNDAIGAYLSAPLWLLILGAVGLVSMVTFSKHREK
jgi:hypothetical protein